MNTAPIAHGSFTIERLYPAAVERVYRAWTDIEQKARWFYGPEGWTLLRRELDFRVGGIEVLHGSFGPGKDTVFTAHYHHIVPNRRIVYAYDMHLGGRHHSLSLATVEIAAVGNGTRLIFNEQVAFLDGTPGGDGTRSREHGTAVHLDRIPVVLDKA